MLLKSVRHVRDYRWSLLVGQKHNPSDCKLKTKFRMGLKSPLAYPLGTAEGFLSLSSKAWLALKFEDYFFGQGQL